MNKEEQSDRKDLPFLLALCTYIRARIGNFGEGFEIGSLSGDNFLIINISFTWIWL
mgnify:FL=1